MNKARFHRAGRTWSAGVVWLIATLAMAQTPPASSSSTPASSQQSVQASGTGSATDDTAAAPLLYVPSLDQPGIQELGGSGNWFSDDARLFSWGSVQVRSAEVLYGYSSANPEAGLPGNLSAAIVQTNVAYVKRLKRSLLVWQYNPKFLYSNGQASLAAANQDVSLNTLFAPTPHVTVGVSEGFTFYGPLSTFNDKTFAGSTDLAISNPFLTPLVNGQQQTWLDTFSVPITYTPSAKTTVRITGLFNYVRTAEESNSTSVLNSSAASMFDYGARVDMNHSLSPNQTVGMFYSYQIDQEKDVQGTTMVSSFGGSASRRLGRGLTINGEAGASNSNGILSTGWTLVGSVSLTKTLQYGSFEANYGRDSTFTGLIGSHYEDHASATYNRQAGRKGRWSVGGGYLESEVLGHHASGKYASAQFDYGFKPNLDWFFGYVHVWETGIGPQLVNGGQSQFQIGLRWRPRFRPGT